jgi:hypothetical protein
LDDARQDAADEIAAGHAWTKHQAEFPEIKSQSEFADLIYDTLSRPTLSGALAAGRSYYYYQPTNTLVIVNPNATDYGTAFRPVEGYLYVRNLK